MSITMRQIGYFLLVGNLLLVGWFVACWLMGEHLSLLPVLNAFAAGYIAGLIDGR